MNIKILRKIIAALSAFLLTFLPVQEVIGEKVKIGFVNDSMLKWDSPGHWHWERTNENPSLVNLFKSEKGKKAFDSFVKAVKDKGIMKIIKLPDPLSDFKPVKAVYHSHCWGGYCAFTYLNLKTGEYESNGFNRSSDTCEISFKVDSGTYTYVVWYFEVEATEANDIKDSLIYCPCRYPQEPLTPVSNGSRWSFDNGFVIGKTVLAVIEAVGIGLCVRDNRKKEKEIKKMEEEERRKKGLIGWIHRIMRILKMDLEVIE
ncbi:MAG: hypothetical protein LBL71_04130 [Endomicrobium sp.]|nr:hypothetical protein [Endomicrobium sp.]